MINRLGILPFVLAMSFPVFVGQAEEVPGLTQTRPTSGRSIATDAGIMVAYVERIPGTEITFEMIPIPAGSFLLGSPPNEPERQDDEGPQVHVRLPAFWMGKCEVTWAEYHAYMEMYSAFKSLHELRGDAHQLQSLAATQKFLELESLGVDGVTAPTPLYDPSFTYYPGEEPDQPAVTMTQFAAKQYTKWLSGITGRAYRLPTEAEWEYAARASSSTAYSFGDDNERLGEFAWYVDNAEDETHPVATKLPNDWGLFDMHGNVAEWVLDGYLVDHYPRLPREEVHAADAVAWPAKLFPRVIRGGCWFDEADQCRSAARHKSEGPDWKLSDPNLPKSPWWFTEDAATGIGFRILRPRAAMDEEVKKKVWEADLERIQQDVADRLDEGRGTQSGADMRLPKAVMELRSRGMIE